MILSATHWLPRDDAVLVDFFEDVVDLLEVCFPAARVGISNPRFPLLEKSYHPYVVTWGGRGDKTNRDRASSTLGANVAELELRKISSRNGLIPAISDGCDRKSCSWRCACGALSMSSLEWERPSSPEDCLLYAR